MRSTSASISATTGRQSDGTLVMRTASARPRAATGSRSRPKGGRRPPPHGSPASTTTTSRSRSRRRCWKPSSRTTTSAPRRIASNPPRSRSASTTTGTPGRRRANLQRFVADLVRPLARVRPGDHRLAVVAPPVAPGQNRGVAAAAHQVAHQRHDRRRLAGAAEGEVADRDHRHRKLGAPEPPATDRRSVERRLHPDTGGPAAERDSATPSSQPLSTSFSRASTVRAVAPRLASTTSRPAAPAARASLTSSSQTAAATRSSAVSATRRAAPDSVISR